MLIQIPTTNPSSPASFLANQNPPALRERNKQALCPLAMSLTCGGVGQRRRGGLRQAHAAHKRIEVCPEGCCHRQVALFRCTGGGGSGGGSPWRGVGGGRPVGLLVDPSGRGTKTQVNKCTGCSSTPPPNIHPHNDPPTPLPPQSHPASLTVTPCVFPPLSPGGLLGAVVHCGAVCGGGGGGYQRRREQRSLNADPLYTDYTLAPLAHPWPRPQPPQRSPTVAGISPDKQLKEL